MGLYSRKNVLNWCSVFLWVGPVLGQFRRGHGHSPPWISLWFITFCSFLAWDKENYGFGPKKACSSFCQNLGLLVFVSAMHFFKCCFLKIFMFGEQLSINHGPPPLKFLSKADRVGRWRIHKERAFHNNLDPSGELWDLKRSSSGEYLSVSSNVRPDETGVRALLPLSRPPCWLWAPGTSSTVFTGRSVDETLVARFPPWQMWTEAAKLNSLNEGNAKSAAALTRAKTCRADCRLLTYPMIQITKF